MRIVCWPIERGGRKRKYVTVWVFGGGMRREKIKLNSIYISGSATSSFNKIMAQIEEWLV
jgi:hypothetical protein